MNKSPSHLYSVTIATTVMSVSTLYFIRKGEKRKSKKKKKRNKKRKMENNNKEAKEWKEGGKEPQEKQTKL